GYEWTAGKLAPATNSTVTRPIRVTRTGCGVSSMRLPSPTTRAIAGSETWTSDSAPSDGSMAASPTTAWTSYTVTGSGTPLTATAIPGPTVTRDLTRSRVACEMRTCGPTVSDSIRPVRSPAGPTTPYFIRSWLPMLPATTGPECTATPMTSDGNPWRSLSRLKPAIARCMAQAHRTARSASSGRSNGAPNNTRIASPINSLIVPRCWRITGVM